MGLVATTSCSLSRGHYHLLLPQDVCKHELFCLVASQLAKMSCRITSKGICRAMTGVFTASVPQWEIWFALADVVYDQLVLQA